MVQPLILGIDGFHCTLYRTSDYLSMPGLKLIHVNDRGPIYPKILTRRPIE